MTVDDMSAPYQEVNIESLIAAANAVPRTELRALVARIVIDSLGRPWDAIKHPRDAHGRFIHTFGSVRALFRTSGGAWGSPQVSGRVVAFDHNGDVWVRLDHVAPTYHDHVPGDIIPIRPDNMESLDTLATIPHPMDANQISQVDALAKRMESVSPEAATALRRAIDPANTQPIAQLADLHEARDLLDQNGSPDAVAVRDMVWDLSDQLGDHPSNEENLHAAQAMIRDHLAKNPTQNAEAIARLDQLRAPAPAGQPSAPDAAQVMAASLHRVADRLQDQNPADAVHVRNVAAALGNVGLSGQDPETRDHNLERAAVAAANIKTPQLRKKILADIKHMRENPPETNAPAPAPERKATLPPPPPAGSLPPVPTDAGALVDWARANAKQGGGIHPHENPDDATPEKLLARQAQVEAEIEAIQKKAQAHENGLPIPAQANRLDALVKEHDAILARIPDLNAPAPAAPEASPAEAPGPSTINRQQAEEIARAAEERAKGVVDSKPEAPNVPEQPVTGPTAVARDARRADFRRLREDNGGALWRRGPVTAGRGTDAGQRPDLAAHAVAQLTPDAAVNPYYAEIDATPLTFLELDHSPEAAALYHDAVAAGKAAGPKFGPLVHLYDAPEYEGMTLYLTSDGGAGFGITPDGDIVSVFSNKHAPDKKHDATASLVQAALDAGGTHLDAFDLGLAKFYAAHGFVVTGRVPFDPAQAPDDWRPDLDSPDVVFMGYDPAHAKAYREGDGAYDAEGYGHAQEAAKALGDANAPKQPEAVIPPAAPAAPPTPEVPTSSAPDEEDSVDLAVPETAEAVVPAVPELPQLGELGLGISFEDMPHGLVLRGNVFPHKDDAKAIGFRFLEVPGEKKRDGAPFKAWTATGAPEKRREMLGRLAERLGLPDPAAAGGGGDEYPPTEQQQAVIDAVLTGKDTVVRALAGTGKTSTLKMIARRLMTDDPAKRIVYVAFNKSIQEEAQRTMPPNVEARTGDSIAFATMSPAIKDKYSDRTTLRRNADIAAFLGITNPLDTGVVGEKPMQPDEQAMRIMRAIEQYSISADDKLGVQHFKNLDPKVAKELLPYAEKAWADINSDGGRIRTTNSHITKMWALSKPDLSKTTSGLKRGANVIFFDEAQDINPVMAKVIADQKIQKVYVGDSNQAIYGFRGAVDELDHIKAPHDLPLTKSWRFGPEIAGMGNRFLALIGAKHRIEGAGPAGRVVAPYSMTDPDAILVRSNAGAIGEILAAQTDGKIVGVPKGTKSDLRKLVDTARWLQGGGPAPAQLHDDLAAFRNWDEVRKAAEAGDDPKVKMLAKIIEDTGVDKLNDLVNRLVESGDVRDNRTPDMYVTTAHKAKGLEWDKVRIGGDFWGPRLDKNTGKIVMPSPEEMKLAYVAVTRAMKELDPGSLEWVYDYTDSNGGTIPSTTPSTPAPPDVPSSPSRWSGDLTAPVEASRPLGPSAPMPDEIATKAADLGLGQDVIDAITNGTPEEIAAALHADQRFAEIQHTYARAVGTTIRTPDGIKARDEWIALQRDVLIPLKKRGVRTDMVLPKTEVVPPAPGLPSYVSRETPPSGWTKVQPEPGVLIGDQWTKGDYAVFPNDDGTLRVAEFDKNMGPVWRADGANWAEIEAKIAEHEDFKKNGGLPADARANIAQRAANYGFGDALVQAIQSGDAKQITDALDADPRYHEMGAAYADALNADLPQGDDRVAIENWIGLNANVVAPLKNAKLLKREPKPKTPNAEKTDTGLPQAPEVLPVPEAPAVPAYSGEQRPIQPRDRAEILRAADAAQSWLNEDMNRSPLNRVGLQNPVGDENLREPLVEAWAALAGAVRDSNYDEANRQLDVIQGIIDGPDVAPGAKDDHQQYIDQVRGVLDKVQGRAKGQFEIPGVAPASPAPHIEQSAPELNAAFDDVLQHDPAANARMKNLAASLAALRDQIREYGAESNMEEPVQRAIDGLNAQDYHAAFNVLDGVFNQSQVPTPGTYDTPQERFSRFGEWRGANDAFSGVWDDWTAMLDANPDLAKYNPEAPAPEGPGTQDVIDAIDHQPGDTGGGPKSDVPGPYDPKSDPEIVIPGAPGDGTPVKDENRVINPRVRGEIEDVKRGIGLPELPDRLDIDRNGAVVFALDLVDVPAAGNQGPQGIDVRRRPAGIGQVRRIYTKNGVRYAEVAFYNPAYVDWLDRNKAKAKQGIKNGEPFFVWDGIRIDKIQKVDGANPDAQAFLAQLGPEQARQYAGRNAGRLAQNRGRVRPELERMANLQYIGDRYVPDHNGLPVGKGDVVVWEGKKYEVVRVNNAPLDKRNVRLDLIPLGADGAPELQAGGKHAEPYARRVQFYDKPLGDAQPAVTVDELKDLVRRLDANKEYIVGEDLRAALEEGDLKQITKAFNEDPAILTYVADARAYVNDYIGRLLQANILGNFDAIKPNEQEMVRKDKNDLLNAMAAMEGRYLEGTGANPRIVREIPLPGPDAEYQGQRPDVLMPLRYVQMKNVVAQAILDNPGETLLPGFQLAMARAGAINLDDPADFRRARDEFIAMMDIAERNGHADIRQAARDLIEQMNRWRDDQDRRRAMVQGGPGGEAQLPAGRTVAPGLVKEPGLSGPPQAPAAPDNRAEIDQTNPIHNIVNYFAHNAVEGGNADEIGAVTRAVNAWNDGNAPTPEDRKVLRDYLVKHAETTDDAVLRQNMNDWVNFLDGRPAAVAPAAPAAPAAPQSPEDIKKAIADVIEARYVELRADRKNNAARKQAIAVQDVGDIMAANIKTALDYNDGQGNNDDTRDTYVRDAANQIDKIRADDPELAAQLDEHIRALRDAFIQQDEQRLIERYFDEADKFHNADKPNNDQRDRMIKAAQDQIDRNRPDYPALADAMQAKLDGMKEQYAADDVERARAVPIGRTDALDNFDAQIDAERKRLRDAGDPRAARDLVTKAEIIAEKLNDAEDAHKAGDQAGRDAALDEARNAIPDLEAINPDLAEAARRAVEGNAARYAQADAAPAGGTGPGTRPIPHDPAAGKVKPTGHTWFEETLKKFDGMTYDDIKDLLGGGAGYGGNPIEWNGLELSFNGERGVVPSIWVKDPNDPAHRFLIKGDKKRGMMAEMDLAQIYRAMGLYMPRVFQLGRDDGNRYPFAMELAGPEFGIDNKGTVGAVFGTPTLAQLRLKDNKEAFQFWLSNMLGANTDRHGANLMWGTYTGADGQEYGALLIIDNGYGLGGGGGLHSVEDMIMNGYGTHHALKYAIAEWARGVSEHDVVETLTEWATRMRAEAQKRLNVMESKAHAQHIIKQADTILADPERWANYIRGGRP